MAIVLKEGKTFTPKLSNGLDLSLSDCYGVIDELKYDKKERTCIFFVNIYANKQAREQDLVVIDKILIPIEDFDLIGNNGLTITKAYELSLSYLGDWKSDE